MATNAQDDEFDENDKPGAERSRRGRRRDEDLDSDMEGYLLDDDWLMTKKNISDMSDEELNDDLLRSDEEDQTMSCHDAAVSVHHATSDRSSSRDLSQEPVKDLDCMEGEETLEPEGYVVGQDAGGVGSCALPRYEDKYGASDTELAEDQTKHTGELRVEGEMYPDEVLDIEINDPLGDEFQEMDYSRGIAIQLGVDEEPDIGEAVSALPMEPEEGLVGGTLNSFIYEANISHSKAAEAKGQFANTAGPQTIYKESYTGQNEESDEEEDEDQPCRVRFKIERKDAAENKMIRLSGAASQRRNIPETLELSEEAKACLLEFEGGHQRKRGRIGGRGRGRGRFPCYGMRDSRDDRREKWGNNRRSTPWPPFPGMQQQSQLPGHHWQDPTQRGHPQERGLTQKGGGHPQKRGGLSQKRGGHSQKRGGHSQERGGHSQERGGYSQERGGYSQERGGYSQEQGGYSQEQGGYSQERGGHSQERGGHSQERGDPSQEHGHSEGHGPPWPCPQLLAPAPLSHGSSAQQGALVNLQAEASRGLSLPPPSHSPLQPTIIHASPELRGSSPLVPLMSAQSQARPAVDPQSLPGPAEFAPADFPEPRWPHHTKPWRAQPPPEGSERNPSVSTEPTFPGQHMFDQRSSAPLLDGNLPLAGHGPPGPPRPATETGRPLGFQRDPPRPRPSPPRPLGLSEPGQQPHPGHFLLQRQQLPSQPSSHFLSTPAMQHLEYQQQQQQQPNHHLNHHDQNLPPRQRPPFHPKPANNQCQNSSVQTRRPFRPQPQNHQSQSPLQSQPCPLRSALIRPRMICPSLSMVNPPMQHAPVLPQLHRGLGELPAAALNVPVSHDSARPTNTPAVQVRPVARVGQSARPMAVARGMPAASRQPQSAKTEPAAKALLVPRVPVVNGGRKVKDEPPSPSPLQIIPTKLFVKEDGAEDDEEARLYSLKLEEQKQLRESILKQKELRRQIQAGARKRELLERIQKQIQREDQNQAKQWSSEVQRWAQNPSQKWAGQVAQHQGQQGQPPGFQGQYQGQQGQPPGFQGQYQGQQGQPPGFQGQYQGQQGQPPGFQGQYQGQKAARQQNLHMSQHQPQIHPQHQYCPKHQYHPQPPPLCQPQQQCGSTPLLPTPPLLPMQPQSNLPPLASRSAPPSGPLRSTEPPGRQTPGERTQLRKPQGLLQHTQPQPGPSQGPPSGDRLRQGPPPQAVWGERAPVPGPRQQRAGGRGTQEAPGGKRTLMQRGPSEGAEPHVPAKVRLVTHVSSRVRQPCSSASRVSLMTEEQPLITEAMPRMVTLGGAIAPQPSPLQLKLQEITPNLRRGLSTDWLQNRQRTDTGEQHASLTSVESGLWSELPDSVLTSSPNLIVRVNY